MKHLVRDCRGLKETENSWKDTDTKSTKSQAQGKHG